MKKLTSKQKAGVVLLTVGGVAMTALAVVACSDDPKPLIPCTCNDKNHLGVGESCGCLGLGCNCGLQVYGTVEGIPIYRKGAVNDMAAAITKVQGAYTGLSPEIKPSFIVKIKEVRIVPGEDDRIAIPDGDKFILELGEGCSQASMRTFMNNTISMPAKSKNTLGTYLAGKWNQNKRAVIANNNRWVGNMASRAKA
jgi:hypothetical protein